MFSPTDSNQLQSILQQIGQAFVKESKLSDPDSVYEEDPVDIRTFIFSPEYLNIGDSTYPVVVTDLENMFEDGKYKEAILLCGIGYGKSVVASIAVCYMVYRTLIIRDPIAFYQLTPGSKIAFMNMSTSSTQAKKIVFGRVATLIKNSKWFNEHYTPDPHVSSELRFSKDICVIPGSSSETAPIGYDILGAVMDEAAFMTETKKSSIMGLDSDVHSAAEEIYHSMLRRIESRFSNASISGFKGLMIIISSPRWKGDFVTKKYEEGKKDPDVYARRRATFDSKPKKFYSGKRFVIDVEKRSIVYNDDGSILETDDSDRYYKTDKNLLTIPIEFLKHTQRNMVKFLRDMCAIASKALVPYITNYAQWKEIAENSKIQHPFTVAGRFENWFRGNSMVSAVHVDLGTGKEGRDACGIALACKVPNSDKILVPFMIQLRSDEMLGVDFEKVREIIETLKKIGFNIKWVTYDGWQSLDSRQQLAKRGFKTEELSMDRTMEPYETLKEAVNNGKVEFYNYQPFLEEIEGLELIEGKKVDHPEGGSKDVADAVCGAVYTILTKPMSQAVMW